MIAVARTTRRSEDAMRGGMGGGKINPEGKDCNHEDGDMNDSDGSGLRQRWKD
jgi:hypothetical protein